MGRPLVVVVTAWVLSVDCGWILDRMSKALGAKQHASDDEVMIACFHTKHRVSQP